MKNISFSILKNMKLANFILKSKVLALIQSLLFGWANKSINCPVFPIVRIEVLSSNDIILVSTSYVHRFSSNGVIWSTERIHQAILKIVSLDLQQIVGIGTCPRGSRQNSLFEFIIDTDSGQVISQRYLSEVGDHADGERQR